MPELPDIAVYLEALEKRILGRTLEKIRLANPFLLRTAVPPIDSLENRRVNALRRLGKRIVLGFEGDRWLVLHLMIAGRLHWIEIGTPPRSVRPSSTNGVRTGRPSESSLPRSALAAFIFDSGTLTLTEAGTKRRASLHVVASEPALAAHDPGGIDPLTASLEDFAAALTRENHTLKRALTDPHLFSGIGNAYSDEILHAAKLSPVALTQKLPPADVARLHAAVREQLLRWTDRLRREAGDSFPEKVTAFRPDMAVHGRFGKPCPVCGTTVQRIAYAENEVNYCPRCQTGGKLLADRSLSRLLKSDWPRTIDEAEALGRA
ncbi:MAG TPA: DNA-formamidopyrimidine glycosylase family protein [Opitutus sp.]|nr:DNA-formamidopyrimidine glycosylase family protein [Opitutus sp.]